MDSCETMEKMDNHTGTGDVTGDAAVGMAAAASAVETVLYGAAAAALIKQQLVKMDTQMQPQMLAQTQPRPVWQIIMNMSSGWTGLPTTSSGRG